MENLHHNLNALIDLAISEDISTGDVTSEAIFSGKELSDAVIIAKADGVFCGGFAAEEVYRKIDPSVKVVIHAGEGSEVKKGEKTVSLEGSTKSLLSGERISLNFLQRMCGIATKTKQIVKITEGTNIKILDTRKTLPGFRFLDKYAVKAGGGTNHRIGLFDMVMIKDNHIKAAGSITKANEMVRNKWGKKYRIEIETTNIGEVREAVSCGADVIMLDNMTVSEMEEAVKAINKRAEIELSGNMTPERIMELRHLDIDYISLGSLTHSVEAFDLSMKFL